MNAQLLKRPVDQPIRYANSHGMPVPPGDERDTHTMLIQASVLRAALLVVDDKRRAVSLWRTKRIHRIWTTRRPPL